MMQNNIKIAITGGIGSGKTTVCNYIREKVFPVFSCDEIYSELLQGEELTDQLIKEFGNNILNSSGNIDRKQLAELVFNDNNKLQKLNSLTHKLIFNEMFNRAKNIKGLVFFEVPLLFEGGYQSLFNEVIVVLRSEEDRVASVAIRDNASINSVKNRIKQQFCYDKFDFAQYYVIHNDGKLCDTLKNTDKILSEIMNKYE